MVLQMFAGRALVPNQTDFERVHEKGFLLFEHLPLLQFDPDDLVHHLVPPVNQHVVANVHLRFLNPQEDKALAAHFLNVQVIDFLIAQFVFRRQFALAPRRVNQNDIELSQFIREHVKIKNAQVNHYGNFCIFAFITKSRLIAVGSSFIWLFIRLVFKRLLVWLGLKFYFLKRAFYELSETRQSVGWQSLSFDGLLINCPELKLDILNIP